MNILNDKTKKDIPSSLFNRGIDKVKLDQISSTVEQVIQRGSIYVTPFLDPLEYESLSNFFANISDTRLYLDGGYPQAYLKRLIFVGSKVSEVP